MIRVEVFITSIYNESNTFIIIAELPTRYLCIACAVRRVTDSAPGTVDTHFQSTLAEELVTVVATSADAKIPVTTVTILSVCRY